MQATKIIEEKLADPERFERPTLRFVVSPDAFVFKGSWLLDSGFHAIKAGPSGAGNTASAPDHFDRARIIMAAKALPSIAMLRQLLRCDPDAGTVVWLPRSREMFPRMNALSHWNATFANRPAFTAKDSDGYLVGWFRGQMFKAHRVIWALHYGAWPNGEIDHINRDRADNRIANLRITTRSANVHNAGLRTTNTSGYPGVSWIAKRGKWRAAIRLGGSRRQLGYFTSPEDAAAAYVAAKREAGL